MTDDDFHTKEHITKHLTAGQYDVIRERTRVNSAAEQAFLNFEEFCAMELKTDRLSPDSFRTYLQGLRLYRSAHGSFKFGIVKAVAGKWWIWTLVITAAIVFGLWAMGILVIPGF